MKQLVWLAFMLVIVNLLAATSCVGQRKAVAIVWPIVNSDIYYTADSIHYLNREDKKPMQGTYTIYEMTCLPAFNSEDLHSAALRLPSSLHSTGSFSNGLKTGKWVYYDDQHKLRDEYYNHGKVVRTVRY